MSGHDRPGQGSEEDESRRVKVTDKRRVHLDPDSPHPQGVGDPESAGGAPLRRPSVDEPPPPSESAAALELAQAKAAEYLDHLQRLQAEFDNYRKRVLREQTRAVDLAAEPLVRK